MQTWSKWEINQRERLKYSCTQSKSQPFGNQYEDFSSEIIRKTVTFILKKQSSLHSFPKTQYFTINTGQKYEVSVQTDAVEYHLPSINMTKSTATIKLDREMS